MDDKDRILLSALAGNARESLVSLARRVGLSRSATQERLRRLERSGAITGYTLKPSPKAEAERVTVALIAVTYDARHRCDDIVPKLRPIPEIASCLSVAGALDLLVRVECSSTAALEQVRQRIEGIGGVASTTTHVVLGKHW